MLLGLLLPGHLYNAIDALTAVPNAGLLASLLNGSWRGMSAALSHAR